MRALAAFIMQGRAQAVAAIAALTGLSWAFPLFSLPAAAAAALPTLRLGAREGAVTIALSLTGVALLEAIATGVPFTATGHALVLWALVWAIAVLLRESGQLSLALLAAAGLGIALVVGTYAVTDDPAASWRDQLQELLRPMLEQQGGDGDAAVRAILAMSHFFTGAVGAGMALSISLSLLIARWWQALLYNPGGFRTEFLGLKLPVLPAYLWLALLALAAAGSEVAANAAISLGVPILLAGFAVLHALLSRTASGRFWLIGVYFALGLMAPLIVPIILIGFSDVWVDWRRRLSSPSDDVSTTSKD
jgi:hypothetical protein